MDEIDKAHPKIINLLYQILEDGKILDAKNNLINFNNNIIIMTTNIGANKKNVGFNQNNKESIINDLKEVLNTSFINRIDDIISFNKLTKENINQILSNKIDNLKEKFKEATINISDNTIEEIINESNYPLLGARSLDKIIKKHLENIIIDNLINDNPNITIDSIFSK